MPSIVGWLECRQYSDKAVWFPVYVTPFSGGRSGKEGTPECKQHSRWAWPLLTQIGWTPYDCRGQQPWNIIAAAHRLSFYFPNEKPLSQQAVLSHCCKRIQALYCKKRAKKNTMTVLRDEGVTLKWEHYALLEEHKKLLLRFQIKNVADDSKNYDKVRCGIWINQSWVSGKRKSKMWQRSDWCSHRMFIVSQKKGKVPMENI